MCAKSRAKCVNGKLPFVQSTAVCYVKFCGELMFLRTENCERFDTQISLFSKIIVERNFILSRIRTLVFKEISLFLEFILPGNL